jgi:cell division protein FtsB
VRKWLILALCAALALVVVLAWFAAEDARQAALLDARIEQGYARVEELEDRQLRLVSEGAPAEEVSRAALAVLKAEQDVVALEKERHWRRQPWHARLRREVRRHTGW